MPLLILGCARVGYDFDSTKVQKIIIDTTTQDDIVNMFGKPWRIGLENGVKTWTYGRYTYKLIGDTDTKDLVIKFTKDDKVKSYTFNKTVER
jgi:hypothetical protein